MHFLQGVPFVVDAGQVGAGASDDVALASVRSFSSAILVELAHFKKCGSGVTKVTLHANDGETTNPTEDDKISLTTHYSRLPCIIVSIWQVNKRGKEGRGKDGKEGKERDGGGGGSVRSEE